jgi:hypothetical protein
MYSESLMALFGKLGDVSMAEILAEKLNEPGVDVKPVTGALAGINSRYEMLYGEGKSSRKPSTRWYSIPAFKT